MTETIAKKDRPVVMRNREAAWVFYRGVHGKRYKAVLGQTLCVQGGKPCYVAEQKRNGRNALRGNHCLVCGTKELFSFPRPYHISRKQGMVLLIVCDGKHGVFLLCGTQRYPSFHHISPRSLVIFARRPLYIASTFQSTTCLMYGATALYETTQPLAQYFKVFSEERMVRIWEGNDRKEKVITIP